MDRREMLARLGGTGAGLALGGGGGGGAVAEAADHPDGPARAADSPLGGIHAHFCGIHVAKKDPRFQLVTQHYCTAHDNNDHDAGDAGQGRDPLFQCLLYDSTSPGARLLGVEYIISDARYRGLPEAEKRYWHPHTYEVLSGGLIAPAMPPAEEASFMKGLLTTWGKAWHTWPDPSTAVPMGEPLLIWSLTGDGQVDPRLVAERDRQFGVSTRAIGERRREQIGYRAPNVPPPRSLDALGRQWTADGDDRPTPL